MAQNNDHQQKFLNEIRKSQTSVLIYLSNGFQLRGTVKRFDNFVIILESEGKQQMIYKHAISTIIPNKEVKFIDESEG